MAGETNTLKIVGRGPDNGKGGVVDNISVQKITTLNDPLDGDDELFFGGVANDIYDLGGGINVKNLTNDKSIIVP
ncbi:MAG: hypothetical protein OCD01_19775 [Fibrobacterales bacterium]